MGPHQDPREASHKGRCEDDVWQGDEGEGKASENRREGLPCGSAEEADLRQQRVARRRIFLELHSPWESHGMAMGGAVSAIGPCDLFVLYICCHVAFAVQ